MAQQTKGLPQPTLRGVYLAGNPIDRPFGTASKCENFRVMPGFWLRLFGGRKGRYNVEKSIQQIHQYRIISLPGSDQALVQYKYATNDSRWTWFSLLTFTTDPFDVEAIDGTYDGNFAYSNPVAVCNTPDRVVFYNGLGVRDGSLGSAPPFSTSYNGVLRYFGLDSQCIGGNPTVAFVNDSGVNDVLTDTGVQIWCGLYNVATEHYGNAVYCGTITNTSAVGGTITVSNLSRLKQQAHTSESSEMYYVFYATIDGGKIPYLILDSGLAGPYKVAYGTSSASLSITSGTQNGWVLDYTHEAPYDNFPPRPMRSLCYANGRLYGIALNGGSGSAVYQTRIGGDTAGLDFTYVPETRDLAGVWWSAASGDDVTVSRLGDPLQCWPLTNFVPTPNGDQPLIVHPSDTNNDVIVFTARAVYRLVETLDGVHTFEPISEIYGIKKIKTLRKTPYGLVWVNQYRQICLLPVGGGQVQIISGNYQALLTADPVCADYLLDSLNYIDQYRCYLADGTCIVHDFGIGGEAYTATGMAYNEAVTLSGSTGTRYHVVADTAIYTQEAQPETGLIPTGIETFTTGQSVATTYPVGTYTLNWSDLGNADQRKALPRVDHIGDENVALVYWGDFQETSAANERAASQMKTAQSALDARYSFKLPDALKFWHKIKLTLTPGTAPTNHPSPETQGDLASNFWGCILRLLFTYDSAENRS